MIVSKDLELDMAGTLEKFLHVALSITERCQRLALCDRDSVKKGGLTVHDAHAPSTAAADGLAHDRVAQAVATVAAARGPRRHRGVRGGHGAARARQRGHPAARRERARGQLVAEQPVSGNRPVAPSSGKE